MNTKNKRKKRSDEDLNLGPDVNLSEIEQNDLKPDLETLSKEDFEEENIKVKISMWIDKKLLLAIKSAAECDGKKYQSLMQEKLKEIFLSEMNPNSRLREIERRLELLENKIA